MVCGKDCTSFISKTHIYMQHLTFCVCSEFKLICVWNLLQGICLGAKFIVSWWLVCTRSSCTQGLVLFKCTFTKSVAWKIGVTKLHFSLWFKKGYMHFWWTILILEGNFLSEVSRIQFSCLSKYSKSVMFIVKANNYFKLVCFCRLEILIKHWMHLLELFR